MSAETLLSDLANPTRLRCLLLLLQYGELCVCELTHVIGASQPNMSRNLAQLRESGWVMDRREGRWIYYSLNPESPSWAARALKAVADGVSDQPPYNTDRKALDMMADRPGAARCA